MIASVIIVIATYFLASGMETELMTADDTGTVSVSIETRPGLLSENADAMLTQAEEIVKGHPDVESYMPVSYTHLDVYKRQGRPVGRMAHPKEDGKGHGRQADEHIRRNGHMFPFQAVNPYPGKGA